MNVVDGNEIKGDLKVHWDAGLDWLWLLEIQQSENPQIS
jgi:hypothetical protein